MARKLWNLLLSRWALVVVALFFIFAQAWGLMSVPDRYMGHVQKLMYVHVPAAWSALLCFSTVFIASIIYLIKRKLLLDHIAAAAAEVGLVFTGLTLVLGAIWGKPTWGVWWTWDPRLTTTAILFLLYSGYLSFRSFIEDSDRRAKLSAPLGILIFLNVPIVYYSVQWWRTLHQPHSSPETVDPQMVLSLRLNAFAFLFIAVLYVCHRYAILLREKRLLDKELTPPELVDGM